MEYEVSVEKRLYCTGKIKIEASSPEMAIMLVQEKIDKGELQTTAVEWNDPQYEDLSFAPTGDVDNA